MPLKFYSLSTLLIIFFSSGCFYSCNAQCTGRYLDTVFSNIDSTMNLVYTTTAGGVADTELMDIYQPVGDTFCQRHLIIFMHGGAFFQGTKNDGDIEELCQKFTQRGYVCASVNYRLASSIIDLYDSTQIFTYAYKAFSDFKAAIRYFYKDAGLSNQWQIDTNSIFIAGSSAGAIAADFVGTLDSVAELAAPFQTIANNNGGIEGNSGNAGYSTKVIAVASLAGAVNSLSWIKPSTPPMVLCQGTADGTVPYDCDVALRQYLQGYYTIKFCGSGEMAPKLDSVGVNYSLMPFPGSGHVPWDTNVIIQHEMDSAVAAFFYAVNCVQTPCIATGIAPLDLGPQVSVYPNPAHNALHLNVTGDNGFSEIRIYDCTGRLALQQHIGGKQVTLLTEGLAAGIYTLRIGLKDPNMQPVIRMVAIE